MYAALEFFFAINIKLRAKDAKNEIKFFCKEEIQKNSFWRVQKRTSLH